MAQTLQPHFFSSARWQNEEHIKDE